MIDGDGCILYKRKTISSPTSFGMEVKSSINNPLGPKVNCLDRLTARFQGISFLTLTFVLLSEKENCAI